MDALANFSSSQANVWVTWVGQAAWQGTIVGLAALAVVALRRRWTAPVRYWILVLALFKFAIPPLASLPTGVFSLMSVRETRLPPNDARNTASATAASDKPQMPREKAPPEPSPSAQRRPELSSLPASSLSNRTATAQVPVKAKTYDSVAPAPSRLTWQAVLIAGHLSGAMCVLILFAVRAVRLQLAWRSMERPNRELAAVVQRIARQLGLRRVPTLRISKDFQVPFSAGVVFTSIVLPRRNVQESPADEVRAILSHELAHHRRGDLWLNLVQVLIGAAWWFHPVVWLLNRAIRSLREDCCDDLLLSRKLVTDETYCSTLLHVARSSLPRQSTAPVCVSITDGKHPLAARIQRIMDENLPRRERPTASAVACLLILAAVILPGARVIPAASPVAAGATPVRSQHRSDARSPARRATGKAPDGSAARPHADGSLVCGRVTDEMGQPVDGATVAIGRYFNNFDFPATTKTDGEGAYRFENCAAGDGLLTIFKVGLAPHTRTVTLGSAENEFDVTLMPGQLIRMRVTDQAGQPIADANVLPFKWADTVTLSRLHNFGKTDAQGIWSWDWAPDVELPYLVTKPGYLDYKYAVLRPGVELHEVKLLPELSVTVRVVDDATGRPIPAFQATLGLLNPKNSPQAQWLAPVSVKSADGATTLRQNGIPWNECVVRIEAAGYNPASSRQIRADENQAAVEIRLRAAGQREAVAFNSDGSPAADASVYLGTETTAVELLQFDASQPGHGFVARTDRDGRFQFDVQGEAFTVFVVGNAGLGVVASKTIDESAKGPVQIQIQPWARVEGMLRQGQKVLSGETINLALENGPLGIGNSKRFIGLGRGAFLTARTDQNGRFAFDRVPPGIDVRVGHLVPVATSRGPMLGYRQEAFFRSAAGELRTIALGGSGRTVVGRFQMKDEAWAVDWGASFGHLNPSIDPDEVGKIDILYRPYPRFPIQQDGSFHLEEIPPGNYIISFELLALKPESSLRQGPRPIPKTAKGMGGLMAGTITVPETTGAAAQPVDIGILHVGYANAPPK